MKGIILTNPFDNSLTQRRKAARMLEEFARLSVDVAIQPNDCFAAHIEGGKAVSNLDADFVIYFDKDKYVAELLEKRGVRVFNKASATAICDDKMQTHIALVDRGVAMPDTLGGTLCYIKGSSVSDEYLSRVVERLGLPVVVKQCYGSYGEQVYLANNMAELRDIVNRIKDAAYLFQGFVAESRGRDMRVIVVGGKVLCGMTRESSTDFRSNIERGGKASKAVVPENIKILCEKAANILDLDYCGVDVLLGDVPQICEVNSNAMFYAMEQVSAVNVAKAYAEHIIKCVKKGE